MSEAKKPDFLSQMLGRSGRVRNPEAADTAATTQATPDSEVEHNKEQKEQQIRNLASWVLENIPFPWDFTEMYISAPPVIVSEAIYGQLSTAVADRQITTLSNQDRWTFENVLRHHFRLEGQNNRGIDYGHVYRNGKWGGPKYQLYNFQLETYVTQVVAALQRAMSEMNWKEIGVFVEKSQEVRQASTQPFSATARTRVIPKGIAGNGESLYRVQARSLTPEDRGLVVEQLMESNARSMVYYDITGSFPGSNPDWSVVSQAIQEGSYVDYLGKREQLVWSSREQLASLSGRYLKLQDDLMDGKIS